MRTVDRERMLKERREADLLTLSVQSVAENVETASLAVVVLACQRFPVGP